MQLQMSCNKVEVSVILLKWMHEPPELRPQAAPASAAGWRAGRRPADVQRSLPEVNCDRPGPRLRRPLGRGGCWPSSARAIWSRSATWTPATGRPTLAGGSKFGYTLLSVILLSNLMAILLQALAARLGIATDRDLAQALPRQLFPNR